MEDKQDHFSPGKERRPEDDVMENNLIPGQEKTNEDFSSTNDPGLPNKVTEDDTIDSALLQQSTPPSENMEVHHHSHSGHHKKTWRDYGWEFLMLFMAVFCGFMAEYFLEHKIEKDRELQFVKSMVADLEDDITVIQQNITGNKSRIALMDSFLTLITQPELVKTKGADIYYMARLGPRILTLTANTKTFDQLKSSGSFRLIGSAKTASRIMEYYSQLPQIGRLEALYLEEFAQYKVLISKLFDPLVFRAMERENGEISREAPNPQLRSTDPSLLQSLGVYIVYMNGSTRSIAPLEASLLQNGRELVTYLKKEYHLD